jgi:cytidylate kinase
MRVLAIDGPSASGKSTLARRCASVLGLQYLDTGAMYRSVAWACLNAGIDLHDDQATAALAQTVAIDVGDIVVVDGVDVTAAIRTPEVTQSVAPIAANPAVRAELVRRQQQWLADRDGGALDGRDIGTVVCPDATLKIYLTASELARALRRATEIGQDPAEVIAAHQARDHSDSSRSTGALYAADDAHVIDTSDLTIDQTVDEVLRLWNLATGESAAR